MLCAENHEITLQNSKKQQPVFYNLYNCRVATGIYRKDILRHHSQFVNLLQTEKRAANLLVSSEAASEIIRDFKSYTAREIIRIAKENQRKRLLKQFEFYKKGHKATSEYQVWQEGFHPQMVAQEDVLRQKVAYIHCNPVRRGLVEDAGHWVYSSAGNYLYGKGCIEIDQIEL